jgi:hypothetical protein
MPSDALPLEKIENPWLRAFLEQPWQEYCSAGRMAVVGELVVLRQDNEFNLRHGRDLQHWPLKEITLAEARTIANFTENGEFRPLKSKYGLQRGWIFKTSAPDEVADALQIFYPNALADRWHAVRAEFNGATTFRFFALRQTGMYRITKFLKEEDVKRVIGNVCNKTCFKQRLWTYEWPLKQRVDMQKIPCLEPCAVFMEAARKEVRALQEKSGTES